MLSDESSSDSETGRFKCKSELQEENRRSSKQEDRTGRERSSRHHNDRFRRDFDRNRNDRDRFDRRSRERNRKPRTSLLDRRRNSRERNGRRSRERNLSRKDSKNRDHRSRSPAKERSKQSRTHHSPQHKKESKSDISKNIIQLEKPSAKIARISTERTSISPEFKSKKSAVLKPAPEIRERKKSPEIVDLDESDNVEEVQPGSYYSMIPAVVKEKKEESSEIDSSDDERLRAKLLNLEKELQKTRKKKHKKRHKRKSSKSKDRDRDTSASVEVSSTTDIKLPSEVPNQSECIEVTSTQKNIQKESSEEGEISSEDNSQSQEDLDIDPSDLRHKLKRAGTKSETEKSPDLRERLKAREVSGPILPAHLQKGRATVSPDIEGPALPPHLKQSRSINIGPTIPEDMRKALEENDGELIKYVSSDEDIGIGPLPAGSEDKWSDAHKRLEERALDIKIKKLQGQSMDSSKVKSREQWMLELPEGKAKYLGLEARSFRAKEGPDMSDRSAWTDTPEEKARKAAGLPKEKDAKLTLEEEARARQIASRDDEQETAIKKHKKKHKREESLLDLHQKKLKKKKKKEEKDEGPKERRPFSRDVDLQVNRFDDAQKKSIIKKAQELDTRFSRGEAKFL